MAKAKLEIPFAGLSGRLSGDSDTYITTRYGETVISNYPKRRDPKKITAHQRELNTAFAGVVAQAKVELSDPVRRAYWQEQFEQYKQSIVNKTNTNSSHPTYKTLRGFTIAHLTKQQINNNR